MRKLVCCLYIILSFQSLFAQQNQLNSAEIKLGLEKLGVIGSVLYVAAHPDDENTRLLAYLANEKKVRTGYLALTRGDGGQNLIGNEQGEELGLIRTQELLAARRVDGAEQFFTRANDFGFSKNPEETFNFWDKNLILSDVVWVIRKFKPDVIITRFPEDGRGGHGHHTASAILAHEAFSAAADPKRFPEQLKYVQPWQAKRILWNTFNFGGNNTTAENQLKINVGGYNSLLGKSYGEIAAESRTNHKSQGFGAAAQRGEFIEYFTLLDGDQAKNDLLEGIGTNWKQLAGGAQIDAEIAAINQNYRIDNPSASVESLINLLAKVEKLSNEHWRSQKAEEVKRLIAACAGLWFESTAPSPELVVNESTTIKNTALISSPIPVKLLQVSYNGQQTESTNLIQGKLSMNSFEVKVPKLTQPYWLNEDHDVGMYTINDQELIGLPENPDAPSTTFTFEILGKVLKFQSPIFFKRTDPVDGEIYQKIAVIPAVSLKANQSVVMLTNSTEQALSAEIISHSQKAKGSVKIENTKGLRTTADLNSFGPINPGESANVDFKISSNTASASGKLNFADSQGTSYRELRTISYPHIPKINYMPVASVNYATIALKTGGKNLGYIIGAGDKVPEALSQVGYSITYLSEDDILHSNLSKFDAIIAGVRFYNVNTNSSPLQTKLLEYVQNGGVYLVQYNVGSNLKNKNIGPYPFQISSSRVTDENAKISFTNPQHRALNSPNKITDDDFKGWVQERGLYFASAIDKRYETPLLMNDPGETPNNGSLLIANYGKGKFVYTSLAFFRELPAGVPGAFRLFANLLAK